MIKKLFKKRIFDERIETLANKHSAIAFQIILIYIVISTFVKYFILEVDLIGYVDTFIITMIASGYVTIKNIKNGVITYDKREITNKRFIISLFFTSIFFAGSLFYFYMKEDTLSDNIIQIILMSIFYPIFFYLGIKRMNKKTEENADKLIGKENEEM